MADAPEATEAAAVLAAVDAYARTLGEKAMVNDLLDLFDRLEASIERLRSVTHREEPSG